MSMDFSVFGPLNKRDILSLLLHQPPARLSVTPCFRSMSASRSAYRARSTRTQLSMTFLPSRYRPHRRTCRRWLVLSRFRSGAIAARSASRTTFSVAAATLARSLSAAFLMLSARS